MKKTKLSIVTLSAILVMMFVFMFPAAAYAEETAATNSVTDWIEKGWGRVHQNEAFQTDKILTRGELVALINSYFEFKDQKEINFTDVQLDSTYYKEVSKAYNAGYVLGRGNNIFDPEGQVTNLEAYIMIARVLNLDTTKQPEQTLKFKDSNEVPQWAFGAVEAYVQEGFLEGKSKIKPYENLLGSDAVEMLEKTNTENAAAVEEPSTTEEEKGNGVASLNLLGAYFVTIENNQSFENGTIEEGNTSDEIILKLVFDRGIVREFWENNQSQIILKSNKGEIIQSEVFRIENSDSEKSNIFIKPLEELKTGKTVNIVIGADLKANNGNTFGEEKTITFTVK